MQSVTARNSNDKNFYAEHIVGLGQEVRQLRKARLITLAELSKASGISVSHISAIERGTVNATFDKIARIADALSVPANWFFIQRPGKGPLERAHVVRTQNRRNLNLLYQKGPKDAGYSDWLLSSTIGGNFYMGLTEYHPHSDAISDDAYSREGEQHCLVIEGELELVLEDEVITVRAGDSYSFPSEILHRTRNVTDRPARLIWATSPIIIPEDVAVESDTHNPPRTS